MLQNSSLKCYSMWGKCTKNFPLGMVYRVTSAGSLHGILHTLSCWSLLWSAACSCILLYRKMSHCMVLNWVGDQSKQFHYTGFKISIPGASLMTLPYFQWPTEVKLSWLLYSLFELYNDESSRGYIDLAQVLHIFFSEGFIKHRVPGWLSEQK